MLVEFDLCRSKSTSDNETPFTLFVRSLLIVGFELYCWPELVRCSPIKRVVGNFWVTIPKNGKKHGLARGSNPGPLAPKARIIPLDQRAS